MFWLGWKTFEGRRVESIFISTLHPHLARESFCWFWENTRVWPDQTDDVYDKQVSLSTFTHHEMCSGECWYYSAFSKNHQYNILFSCSWPSAISSRSSILLFTLFIWRWVNKSLVILETSSSYRPFVDYSRSQWRLFWTMGSTNEKSMHSKWALELSELYYTIIDFRDH